MTKRETNTASTTSVPTATTKTAANKTAATKTAATKTAATKTAANKTAANKTAANKTAANKTAATKTAATKTAATKTAATKTAATKTAANKTSASAAIDAKKVTRKSPARATAGAAVNSRLPFTVEHPELQAVAAWRGWNRPGLRLGLSAASLVYTTDHWSTVKTASLEGEGDEGFVLADVPAGTPIEFAVRASLVAADVQGGAPAGAVEFWLNNSGRNYSATTL